MATSGALGSGGAFAAGDVFLRKATGLVRAWSVFDAFIYAFFSVNLITLGLYIFSFAPFFPNGNLMTAIVISTVFVLFEVVVYAMLIAAMPRAGGDYVWQSRILGGGIGFVLAITGWWFILWLWVPLYGTMLAYEVISPLLVVLGAAFGSQGLINVATSMSTGVGLLISSFIVIAFAAVVISLGMKWYARIQRWCFWGGLLGLLTLFLVLLVGSQPQFQAAFDQAVKAIFGVSGNPYQDTIALAAKAGYTPLPLQNLSIGGSLALIPLILFWNLWPNWGATLFGEVRGATDLKRNFIAMALGLISAAVLAIVLLLLFSKTLGYDFYNAANFVWGNAASSGTSPVLPVWPYPGLMAAFLLGSPILQLWLILSLSLWFWGWCGTVFLSSTRVIFAAAFDRVLPEWAADVSERTNSPINALLLMVVPSAVLSILYAFNIGGFQTLTLDATVAIAITYLGSTVAALILPWRKPELFNDSVLARYRIAGIPLISIGALVFLVFLVLCLYAWITDATYGVNNPTSAIFMVALYLLAVVIYLVARWYRSRQGLDLRMVYTEIPVE